MAIDLSENGMGFEQLKAHIGHKIVVVGYGPRDNYTNIAIECEDCGEVLVELNEPEEDGSDPKSDWGSIGEPS